MLPVNSFGGSCQCAHDKFATKCFSAGMKISTIKIETFILLKEACTSTDAGGEVQVFCRVIFMSDGGREVELQELVL